MTTGTITQINVSLGGVPKLPIEGGMVTELGFATDDQKHKKFHGGPTRALCLYSLDLMRALNEEGHPIRPGMVGENLTVSGVDWQKMTIGSSWHIGEGILIEITGFAPPCKQIKEAFADKNFNRIHPDKHPGWARAYARVVFGGEIRPGMTIRLAE